jgi:D-beta-D-heptose 7-phosphate kinase/D-beta-D-heptose 1-phosphate adenosyltransferase
MFDHPDSVWLAVQQGFSHKPLLVVGDLMLDRYVWGDVSRISPEAPVPVVRVTHQTTNAGGAANVALNLTGLGLMVTVAGFVGADQARDELLALLAQANANITPIITTQRPTTVKTRILGGHQQMLRLDVEEMREAAAADVESLLAALLPMMTSQTVAAIILSDYAKGALTPHVCQNIIRAARARHIPVLVDPKGHDYAKYHGATLLSPNRTELAMATAVSPQDADALIQRGQQLRAALELECLTFTRSEQGITLIAADTIQHDPARAREVFDVSGAGDTVIATLAAGMAAGLSRMDSVRLANIAAGIVVGKVGTVPITHAELLRELHPLIRIPNAPNLSADKICDLHTVVQRVAQWRAQGERIVFTNGCFDLLHVGHVAYLEQARREGQRLIVGLNTDDSVRRLKGASRPINTQADRARVLAALASTDAVVLFDEDTPLNMLNAIRPDVYVKGADYTEAQLVEAPVVKSWGGRVALMPLVAGQSTTQLIRRMKDEG